MKKKYIRTHGSRSAWCARFVPKLLDALEDGPQTADSLADRTGLKAPSIPAIIVEARAEGHKIYAVQGGAKANTTYELA